MANLDSSAPQRPPAGVPVEPPVPIAGIGASAGGLAATSELLKRLGARPGMGIVVVHHLDPVRESSLVEILSRAASMPVQAAGDGVRVEANQVYVLPPNAGLRCSGGLLRLSPRIEERGLHLPIDRFFESLAEDRQAGAIGVLLSGSGSDGSLGIRAIKAAGGITFAQDASAEYRSMPDSAIATGCVDFVLDPAAIAAELVRIGERPPGALAGDVPFQPEAPEFRRLLSLLRAASGIDFNNYRSATLLRRAQRRVLLHRLTDLREYVELLERDAAEVGALCEDVLIHVTGFFRDPATFDALRSSVFPRLLEHRPAGAPIRVWVAGCSTGEEVYSLAISLLEFLASANAADIPLKLFGTDVSARAIERARAGTYAEGIEQQVSPERLETFFSNLGGQYQIRKDVRDLCVFARHDATRDPPFSGMDLISCRNLIIYLGAALQARLLSIFHYALKEPGFLLLGSSETTHSAPGFAACDEKHRIYQRTAAPSRLLFDFAAPAAVASSLADEPKAVSSGTRASGPLDVHREADRVVLEQVAPPGIVVTDDLAILQFRGKTAPYLEPAPGVPALELLRMVREELRLPLRQAIDEARVQRSRVRTRGVRLARDTTEQVVELEILPLTLATQHFFLVLFRDVTPEATPPPGSPADAGEPAAVAELRRELATTRDYLEATVEQLEASNEELEAANEEITSSNEELRSTNEELQMAKEELEASNEELRTLNEEMALRNLEATRLSDDLMNVLSSVEIPILLLGSDSKVRRFAPAAGRVMGLTATDIGRPLGELQSRLALAGAQMTADMLAQLRPTERTLADEAGHWYQLNARPYLTLDRRIDGTVLSAFDINAAQEAAARLREAQKYAESIVETVSESLLVVDAARRVRSGNRAFAQTFGLSAQALAGQPLRELLPLPEWRALADSLDTLEKQQGTRMFRIEPRLPGGESRAFLAGARRIEDTSLTLLVLEDVSERERSEQALRRSASELRDVLTTAPEGILLTDASGRITFSNTMIDAIFGYGPEELIGQSVDVLVPPCLRESHSTQRAQYLAAATPRRMGKDRKLHGLRKDGKEVDIELTLSPISRPDGVLVVCFVSDVSERREAERRIAEYQKMLQQMAFDAALTEERERRRIAADLHDRIGQSLALAQLKLKSLPASEQGGPVEEASALLSQSIIDTRTLVFELSPPILYDLGLKEALSWLAEDLGKRSGVPIEVTDDELPKVLGDTEAALVYRAVRELLTNVLKHAQAPAARVSLQRRDDQLLITVADDGVGFDPAALGALTPVQGGFGLFSVREQVSRLGGTLEVQSASRQGTRVLLRLPLHEPPPRAADAESVGSGVGGETRAPEEPP